jgi:molybdenum cofactor cytidylyltransferase
LISGLVLAAGTSSRLGRPKQLLILDDRPVIRHVVDEALTSTLDEVVVVLGAGADAVRAVLPSTGRLRTVVNADFAAGQASSLTCGLRAAAGSDAVVVLLGDQPGIPATVIDAVVAVWNGERTTPMVQAAYGGHRAHPTLIDRSIWWQLESLSGDRGARAVFEDHPEWVGAVEVGGDPPDDIDTEEDYQRVRELFEIRRDSSGP